jgi:hypothetical protein
MVGSAILCDNAFQMRHSSTVPSSEMCHVADCAGH